MSCEPGNGQCHRYEAGGVRDRHLEMDVVVPMDRNETLPDLLPLWKDAVRVVPPREAKALELVLFPIVGLMFWNSARPDRIGQTCLAAGGRIENQRLEQ